MARRILNRKDLRNDYDAAERRKADDEEVEEEEDSEADGDEDEEDDEEDGEDADSEDAGEDDELDEDGAPVKKKKKKKVPKVKEAKPKRDRKAKVVRQRVVWGVFNNSSQRVATYDYPKKKEAEEHAARLTGDKKTTYFVQPVKEPIEDKKD